MSRRTRAIRAANLETRLAEARLKTLEAELHPHFLFNTLHAISTLVHVQPEAADRMISRLSDLLRITFARSGAARITLQEELEFLQKYLDIEQTRFQDRLTVAYDIDPDTLDAEVPRMILQPLVENAIKHGIAPRSAPGTIQILAARDGETLWLEVRDNGAGLSGTARAQPAPRRRPFEHARSARVPVRRQPRLEFPGRRRGTHRADAVPLFTADRRQHRAGAGRMSGDAAARVIRVLIADDEPLARERLRMLLADEQNVEVVAECADGPTAVAAIESAAPDLVFLDVQMPGASGFDVIDAVGADTDAVRDLRHRLRSLRAARVRRPRARLPAQAVRSRSLPLRP